MPALISPADSLRSRTKCWVKRRLEAVDRLLHTCTPEALTEGIRALGVQSGDVMMVHSAFGKMRFFEGTAVEAITALLQVVGPNGTLVMPTFPFKHRSHEYLSTHPLFDVARSPAYTGLLCELFRRRPDTVRSLQPSHPVAAVGPLAEHIAAGYERAITPFDRQSPWHRMHELNAWIINVGLGQRELAITQYHYAEEMLHDLMPVPLYWPEPFPATVRDLNGCVTAVQAYAHHPHSHKDYRRIISWQHKSGVLKRSRVGAVELWACRAVDLLESTAALARRGCTVFSEANWDDMDKNEPLALAGN